MMIKSDALQNKMVSCQGDDGTNMVRLTFIELPDQRLGVARYRSESSMCGLCLYTKCECIGYECVITVSNDCDCMYLCVYTEQR